MRAALLGSNMHGIADEAWEDYLCGQAVGQARELIDAHLTICSECRELAQRLKLTARLLREAGTEARRRLAPSEDHLYHGLHDLFARVLAEKEAQSGQHNIRQRLSELEVVIAEMCGTQTAARALRSAARRSPARSLEQLTIETWQPFLERLTAITSVVCGKFGGQVVWEAGQL